jgi:hypothetical protein
VFEGDSASNLVEESFGQILHYVKMGGQIHSIHLYYESRQKSSVFQLKICWIFWYAQQTLGRTGGNFLPNNCYAARSLGTQLSACLLMSRLR